uniref:Uncharacterized protein n=1 Tax=Candidatus Kentrum sp. DK TaxID=2126562 RepID=A0A450SED0_9GAMM|nr:MAG: hypothetical protein BECKDK2373B_GA0170837_103127 [Candidatus Kentron sp. DK]
MQPKNQPPDIFPKQGIVLVDLRIMEHADNLATCLISARNSLKLSDTQPRRFITQAQAALRHIRSYVNIGRGDALHQQFKKQSAMVCDGCDDLRKAGENGERMERLYPREQG